jgi:hypothetical protein
VKRRHLYRGPAAEAMTRSLMFLRQFRVVPCAQRTRHIATARAAGPRTAAVQPSRDICRPRYTKGRGIYALKQVIEKRSQQCKPPVFNLKA